MAVYGSGQMLGSGINPESFKQDYSGFANAAAIQAQGIANLGQSIGGAIEDYGKIKKQQQQDERDVQKSKSLAKAIGDLVPDLKPALKSSLELIDNKEIPLSQRKAEADAISDILTLGIGAITNKQKLDLERSQIEAATNEAKARAANKPMTLAEIAMGGGKQQVMLDPITGIAKPITMQGFEGQPQQTSPLSNLPQPLQPYAKTFEEAGARHGVPPALLAAISMQETGGGTSSAFRNKNNAMGISDRSGPITMPSVEASIEKMANLLGKGINEGTGPYAGVKSIEDIGRIYAPAGAVNDPRNLNPGWSQGVTSQLQKLMQAQQPAASPSQSRVGFTPDKPDEQGQILTNKEVTELIQQGFKIKGRPTGDGKTFVTAIESLAPQQGKEIVYNPDGTVTMRDVMVGGDLNKSPTTNLKEGQALVPDPTSPTGTKVVEIPSDLKEKALNNFSNYIAQVGDSYAKLNQMGKAVSGGEANPLNYVFATPIGQTMGRMFGEEGQILRDQINTMAPNIVNVIRQSTEMGAKGMDSDSERLFFIKSMGDPTLPIEANIKALDALDKAYGKGNAVETMLKNYPELAEKVNKYKLTPPKTESGATGGLITPEQQSLIDKYKPKSR